MKIISKSRNKKRNMGAHIITSRGAHVYSSLYAHGGIMTPSFGVIDDPDVEFGVDADTGTREPGSCADTPLWQKHIGVSKHNKRLIAWAKREIRKFLVKKKLLEEEIRALGF